MYWCVGTYVACVFLFFSFFHVDIAVSKLSMYGGVLALGIGDSVAAVAGQLMGRQKWPGVHCISFTLYMHVYIRVRVCLNVK